MKIAFISNEETKSQILTKMSRLGLENQGIDFHFDWKLPDITSYIREQKPDMVVFDSIQTVTSNYQSQVEAAKGLKRLCNLYGCTLLVIGHENKDGSYTGARAIEHELDAILEMKKGLNGEIIVEIPHKNRMGSTGKRFVCRMTENGLVEKSPRETGFLDRHTRKEAIGTAAFVTTAKGEITVDEVTVIRDTVSSNPELSLVGSNSSHARFLSSVISASFRDFIPGYIIRANLSPKLTRASDLACVVGTLSVFYGKPIPLETVFMASLDASGRLLPIEGDMENMAKRAYEQGYSRVIGPAAIGSQKTNWVEADSITDVWRKLGY
jgi:DNA repair protein RadA/Sms